MQRDERKAAVPPTVGEQIESLLSEPRAAKTSLGQAESRHSVHHRQRRSKTAAWLA